MPEVTKRLNRRKVLQGTVVSDKMNKTRTVQVKWSTKHSKYTKVVRTASKYKAHDEKNESKAGDIVRFKRLAQFQKINAG